MESNPRHRIHMIYFAAALVLLTLQLASAIVLQHKGTAGEKFTEKLGFTGTKIMTNLATGEKKRIQLSGSSTGVTRVVSVSPRELELEVTTLSGEITTTTSGRRQTRPVKKSKHWMRITLQGKVLERKPKKTEEELDTGARVLRALAEASDLPKGNINVGDVWQTSLPVREPGRSKPIHITLESKLLGMVEFKGHSCAKISSTFQTWVNSRYDDSKILPAGVSADMSGKMSGVMTNYFDPKLGREVYSEGTLQSNLITTVRMQGPSQQIKTQAKLSLKSFLVEPAR
jgi:hypothetical protein